MNHLVSLKEFRTHVDHCAQRIQQGESLIIMRRSKPLFRIVPVEEDEWETVMDFTTIRKQGIPARELLARLRSLK